MAVFAYGRVSTKDQTTGNQRQEIERAGYKVECWYADEGVSGKVSASQRPQFKALLSQIRDGETLLVSKLDRLGRDAQDVGATIKALPARKIEVIVLQRGNLDLASPAGKLMAGTGAAAVYALHCPEMAALFLGTWYVLGIAFPTAVGAVLGPRLLHW